MLAFVYRSIDEVCTIEVRPPSMPRGVVRLLYEEAREKKDEPWSTPSLRNLRIGADPSSALRPGRCLLPYLLANTTVPSAR